MDHMARLLLVRHATTPETGRSLTGRLPGHVLNEDGLAMAAALGNRLSKVRLTAIYTSPMERTRQTAEAIAARQTKKTALVDHPGLLEVDYGTWSGRTLRSLYRLAAWRLVATAPSRVQFPGGESLVQAQARAVDACEELARRHGNANVAIVTHADIIKAVVSHYLGQPLDLFNRVAVSPASVTVLDLGADGPVRLVTLNSNGDPATWS
ncbi:MAG TPA: histidine phosphatase family protein [Acidimicrobiia bacterium]|nr:histidine phosphatase family protein [Acidimicrobiia bacterium]